MPDQEHRVSFTLVLTSPDRVNELGRNAGLPVQPLAMTDGPANKIYLSWPPMTRDYPYYEYGMDIKSLLFALGYEVYSNLLHLDTDPLGR